MPIKPSLTLGVLDQSPIPSGSSAAEALSCTLELARITERLGYARYWVAEHHGSQSFAGSAPEILIDRIASVTQRIRVGSAGVMLMHYSPLKVAEQFRVLAALHPDRIDLGIGRAPGSDGLTAAALAYGSQIGIEYLPAKIADLDAFITDQPPYTDALNGVQVTPSVETPPVMWMLGSTEDGARLAAHFGLPFAFAHFINPDGLATAATVYRDRFRPTPSRPRPRLSVGVFALCADDEAHASRLARCRDVWRLRVERGEFGPIPSIEEAAVERFTAAEQSRIDARQQHQIVGTPTVAAAKLRRLASSVDADELSIVSITHQFADRVRCYELLAGELLGEVHGEGLVAHA